MKKVIKKYLISFFCVIFSILIIVIAINRYGNDVESIVGQSLKERLQSNADALAKTFSVKLSDQLSILDSQVSFFEKIELENYKALKETISLTEGIGSFKDIYVVTKYGVTVSSDGKVGPYVGGSDFSFAAKGKKGIVSKRLYTDVDGESVVCIAVPIFANNETSAYLYGTITASQLAELMGGDSLSQGKGILITRDGNLIAATEDYERYKQLFSRDVLDKINTYSYENESKRVSLKETLKTVDTGAYYVDGTKEREILVMSSIENSDWVYAFIVPKSIVSERTAELNRLIGIFTVEMCISFAFLLLGIFHVMLRSRKIEKENERYARVSSQSQIILFEYDYGKKRLEMSGDFRTIVSAPKGILGEKDIKESMYTKVHPDDLSILNSIENLHTNNDEVLRAEARILCTDGEYKWFRLNATIKRASDGSLIMAEGDMSNVEERVKEEQLLKQKAETDPLTGILNKGAMQTHVENILLQATTEEMIALYIIDLDNFKNVNDSLGHAVGDRVLTDVAQKMISVFYENDILGRIGGDEFAALVRLTPDGKRVGMKIIEGRAKALCRRIDEVYSNGKNEVHVSASVGVALFPTDGLSYNDLYRKADAALYAAKNSGKNQCFIYGREEI